MRLCLDREGLRRVLHKLLCSEKRTIVCIGTELREDDRAGLEVCRRLRRRGIDVVECVYGLENCVHEFVPRRRLRLLIVDAVYVEGAEPGDIVLASVESIVPGALVTTHSIPIDATLRYLRNVGSVEDAVVLGIRVERLGIGEGMSSRVEKAVEVLAREIERALLGCGARS